MGAKVGGNKGGAMGDINVTPLVDVVLVLLIIFMVVTPMLSSGDGAIFVDSRQVPLEILVDEVNAEFRATPNRAILIKADSGLHYGEVRAVMDTLSDNGMTTLLLAAEKLKEN